MVRTLVLALALAVGGGAPYLGGFVDLLQAMWAAGGLADPNGSTTYAGSHYDPNGAGGHFDPDGSSAGSDIGGMYDPNGSDAESDVGAHFDPNG